MGRYQLHRPFFLDLIRLCMQHQRGHATRDQVALAHGAARFVAFEMPTPCSSQMAVGTTARSAPCGSSLSTTGPTWPCTPRIVMRRERAEVFFFYGSRRDVRRGKGEVRRKP